MQLPRRYILWVLALGVLLPGASAWAQAIVYVNAAANAGGNGEGWPSAYQQLQDALAAAASSGGAVREIWMAAGMYRPTGPGGSRDATFQLVPGVSLYGGFAGGEITRDARDPEHNLTMLTGDLNADDTPIAEAHDLYYVSNRSDNCKHVLMLDTTSTAAVLLDGLTIRGGYANTYEGGNSGGGLCIYGGTIALNDCTFTENFAVNYGGGVAAWDFDIKLTVTACQFVNNLGSQTGGGLYSKTYASFTDCQFIGNYTGQYGGGLFSMGSGSTVTRCQFIGNTSYEDGAGAGATLDTTFRECVFAANAAGRDGGGFSGTMFTAMNCVFAGNTAKGSGGGVCAWNRFTMANVLFSGNNSKTGGGLYVDEGTMWVNLSHCTFSRNNASSQGGGVHCYDPSSWTLANSILWQNMAPQGPQLAMTGDSTSSLKVAYCDVQGGQPGVYCQAATVLTWGAGNINSDPRFIDADGADTLLGTVDDDLRLCPGSPCLDAGDNSLVFRDVGDLDGDGDTSERLPLDLRQRPRFMDQLDVPDTGAGTPPVCDLGAYEGIDQCFVSVPELSLAEGSSRTIEVSLALDPGKIVEVTVAYCTGDDDVRVTAGDVLTFTPSDYAVPQVVTLTAAEDADFTDGTALVRIAAEGIPPADIRVTEQDNDPPPAVLYVDSSATGLDTGMSWSNAFREVQAALAAIRNKPGSREIRVAQGVYRPDYDPLQKSHTLDRTATFQLIDGVSLLGGFAGQKAPDPDARAVAEYPTILTGDLKSDDQPSFGQRADNSNHVVSADSVSANTRLDGFTIRGGNGASGPGICLLGASPVVAACTIEENDSTSGYGGGVYSNTGSPTLVDCIIRSNRAYRSYYTVNGTMYVGRGGGLYNETGSPALTRCRIEQNLGETHGGGLYTAGGQPVCTACVFGSNACTASPSYWDYEGGGGIYTQGSGHLRLFNCVILGNTCYEMGGGIYKQSGGLTAVNCRFAGNANHGLYANSGSLTLVNCNIVSNNAIVSTTGAGLYVTNLANTPVLTNCILWDNACSTTRNFATQINLTSSPAKPAGTYCNIQGWTSARGGAGNKAADPQFLAPGHWELNGYGNKDDVWVDGDYRLMAGSPCIDAGQNAAVPPDSPDLDGDGNRTEPLPLDLEGLARMREDPATADTGAGTPPLVDMGAYEYLAFAPADFDRDRDVDADDLVAFRACLIGPNVVVAAEDCRPKDLDGDNDVDQSDFGLFQRYYSGSGRPATAGGAD